MRVGSALYHISTYQSPGFQHSAFVLRAEGRLEHSSNARKLIPRGELVELLSKALLYTEVEAHWRGNAMTTNCKGAFSLLDPHVCTLDPSLPASTSFHPPPPPEPLATLQTNGTSEKRKASTPASEAAPKGKRARTEDMDMESSASTAARMDSTFDCSLYPHMLVRSHEGFYPRPICNCTKFILKTKGHFAKTTHSSQRT